MSERPQPPSEEARERTPPQPTQLGPVAEQRLRLVRELSQAMPKGIGAVLQVIQEQLKTAPKEAIAAALEELRARPASVEATAGAAERGEPPLERGGPLPEGALAQVRDEVRQLRDEVHQLREDLQARR